MPASDEPTTRDGLTTCCGTDDVTATMTLDGPVVRCAECGARLVLPDGSAVTFEAAD